SDEPGPQQPRSMLRCRDPGKIVAERRESEVESPSRLRSVTLAIITVFVTLIVLFGVGEVACRVFWPDRQLRYEVDPVALFRFAPSQTGFVALSDGTEVSHTTLNQYGFRGPERPAEARRSILLLGDSFTFGSGVNDDETFASRLGRALGPEVQVWNGGQ